jgi:hypothetical protein
MSTGKTTTKAKSKTTTQGEEAEAQKLITISWNDLKKEDRDKVLSGLPCLRHKTAIARSSKA